jgi:lipopolysaccharide/colanic/teichoic acid biosynthesis glycosyltransferase
MQRWELHRIPELLNVLRGELALVGARPLAAIDATRLNEEWQQARLECRPGLTGLWYTEMVSADVLDAVIVTDLYFAATQTLHATLAVLLWTPLIWLRKGIRGLDEAPDDQARVTQGDVEAA